ncbi:MAG: FAD-dependent monooxygenase [Burkholderiales bacterium]|nr:FAD-dependent monooxygenase [Burkholderiales bacterium]
MTRQVLIVGGGIGGLAAALGARAAGFEARVLEQAQGFSEVGAGIQLGPNTTAILREWALLDGAAGELFVRPERLAVRDALSGEELGALRLGRNFEERYGAPYVTVHRADLQRSLLLRVRADGTPLDTVTRVLAARQDASGVAVKTSAGSEVAGDALVGADGLWSRVREYVLPADEAPRPTGHIAYRGLLRLAAAPAALRESVVTAWLGPALHVVAYPVRGGTWLNVVCVVEGKVPLDARGWDHEGLAAEVDAALAGACTPLRDVAAAVPEWRMWALHDRAPVHGASAMAAGRIALLGDAAHPMLPYLAQGAGMALEDARELQCVLASVTEGVTDLPAALQRYALNRWERCARVQRRSRRNGTIFHATGALRWGRDTAMRLLGERLLDLPWLYGGR